MQLQDSQEFSEFKRTDVHQRWADAPAADIMIDQLVSDHTTGITYRSAGRDRSRVTRRRRDCGSRGATGHTHEKSVWMLSSLLQRSK
jgi:hypothetical protein